MAGAARMANIGRATLYRWMNDPDFKHSLEALRADAASLARTELNGLVLKSVLVVAQALEDPSPAVRLRAAQTALAMGFKANDLHDMARRLERVDEALHLWTSRNTNW
jgi:HEAT repeat protein